MLPYNDFRIRQLLLDDGSSPFGKWFCNLDPVSAVKVQVALARIEQGNVGSIKWFEGIGEIKIHWGAGLRIYVGKQDIQIILLRGGGHKDSQDKDIKLALSRWRRFKQTKSDKEI